MCIRDSRPTAHPALLDERPRLLVWRHPSHRMASYRRPGRPYSHPTRFPVPDEYLEPRYLQRAREKGWGRGPDAGSHLRTAGGDHGGLGHCRRVRAHDGPAPMARVADRASDPVSYTHLRAHETDSYLVCRLL